MLVCVITSCKFECRCMLCLIVASLNVGGCVCACVCVITSCKFECRCVLCLIVASLNAGVCVCVFIS